MSRARGITTVISALTIALGLATGVSASAGAASTRTVRPSGVEITPIDTALSVIWTGAVGSSTINGYTVTATGPKHQPVSCVAENPATSCILSPLVNGQRNEVSLQPGEVTSGPHGTENFTPVGKPARKIRAYPTAAQNCSYIGSFANLQDCDLSNADMSGVLLDGADLAGTNLTKANLNGVNLAEANLQGATLTGINLSAAFFNATNLSDDTLTGLDLAGADFDNTNLAGFDLTGSDLSNAILISGNLDGTDLAKVNLAGGSIDDSTLVSALFTRANLTNGALADDNLTDADFSKAKTTGVNWVNSTCPDGTTADADGGTCANDLR